MNMTQVLITGGLGFIGMECCNQFLQHGRTVQILDIKTLHSVPAKMDREE